MSVSIFYRPLEDIRYLQKSLETDAIALRKTFGDFPISLTRDDYRILLAMAEVWGGFSDDNPYLELAEAIETNGNIFVDVEY